MQKSQTAKLLAFTRSIEGGEVRPIDVEAWHELIGHLDYTQAITKAKAHYNKQTRRLWPADLIKQNIKPNEEWMYR